MASAVIATFHINAAALTGAVSSMEAGAKQQANKGTNNMTTRSSQADTIAAVPPKKLILRAAVLLALAASAVTPVRAQSRPAADFGPVHPDAWMGELFTNNPALLNQPLARFIFPGTHDSGTYGISTSSPLADDDADTTQFIDAYNTCLTDLNPYGVGFLCSAVQGGAAVVGPQWAHSQTLSIHDQLAAGARSLDLRFFYDPGTGNFYIHHTFKGPPLTCPSPWVNGACVLSDILQFLKEPNHTQEVILLNFGAMVIGDGATTTNLMTSDQLNEFFGQLYSAIGPYMAQAPNTCVTAPCPATALFGAQTTFTQMQGQGNQVIVTFDGAGPHSRFKTY